MKKSFMMFLFVTVVLSMLITGCSDDKKSSTGPDPSGPVIDPTDYNYYFGVSSLYSDRNEEYLIAVSSYDGTIISTVEVSVSGETYILESAGFGAFIGYIDLPDAGVYSYEVVIDGDKEFSFNLSPAPIVNAQWPDAVTVGDDFDVTWTLTPNQDPQVQEFSGYAYDEMDNEEDVYETLLPSARSYTVPGNWFSNSMTSFDYDLIVANYEIDGQMIAVSVEGSFAEYYSYGKSENNKLDLIKKAALIVAK